MALGKQADPTYLAFLNLTEASEQLEKAILESRYSSAVALTESFTKTDTANTIRDVVNKLINSQNTNILSYAYQLWNNGHKKIVKEYFPTSYKLIFNEEEVLLSDKRNDLALKLGYHIDGDGDRTAYGDSRDKTSRRVSWKILPIFENNRVHFKIKDLDCNMFLKMGLFPDSYGDRPVYGATTSDGERYTWNLVPVMKDAEFFYRIENRQFGQALKLDVNTDSDSDRRLWGHNTYVSDAEDRFLWRVKKFSNGHDESEL